MNEKQKAEDIKVDTELIQDLTPSQAQALSTHSEVFDDLIPDQKLLGTYENLLTQIKEDKEEISTILTDFLNMVLNDGDSSAATKEAVVNLVKAKNDNLNNSIKIADLMTRLKMKERNTFKPYLAPQQNNVYNFGPSEDEQRKSLLDEIDKAAKRKK